VSEGPGRAEARVSESVQGGESQMAWRETIYVFGCMLGQGLGGESATVAWGVAWH
jgi:hypothetical protein